MSSVKASAIPASLAPTSPALISSVLGVSWEASLSPHPNVNNMMSARSTLSVAFFFI